MKARNDNGNRAASAWYRQPVLWLGALVFVASLAGCVWLIVVSVQYADTPLRPGSHAVLGVPVTAHSTPPPPADPPAPRP
ncbi:MAG: hypothetical protein WBA65_03675 [Rhodanobacter sp.]|jgi:hypothetical protein